MTTVDTAADLSLLIDRVDPGPLYRAAIEEVGAAIGAVLAEHGAYRAHRVFERLLIPDRVIRFRVEWVTDGGDVRVNTGWRVQHCNALGAYKGGLRFHPSVTEDTLQFLAFEQCFKNALTGLPIGGGKGGADFDPKGKSDAEVMRFCQAFMRELHRHIGASVDIPAGDIGVGGREIGYLAGAYIKTTGRRDGVLTGKPTGLGGLLGRTEATGYGLVMFASSMLETRGGSLEGARVAVSGSGNVAVHAAEYAHARGAVVVSLSDSGGTLVCERGLSGDMIEEIKRFKEEDRGRLEDWAGDGCVFHPEARPWSLVDAEIALPCATQHEVEEDDARALVERGVRVVAEGANMPCTAAARRVLGDNGVVFGPGKAANAGGVATSVFEMSQNATREVWSRERTLGRLGEVMAHIHERCVAHAPERGGVIDYGVGADRAGFVRIADTLVAMGV